MNIKNGLKSNVFINNLIVRIQKRELILMLVNINYNLNY